MQVSVLEKHNKNYISFTLLQKYEQIWGGYGYNGGDKAMLEWVNEYRRIVSKKG